MIKKYKKIGLLSIGSVISICLCHALHADLQEDRLTRSIVRQVQKLSKKTRSLGALGKATFTQSTTILDLGESSIPVLLKTLSDPKKNWMTRYWVTDSLGYVGNLKTLIPLLRIVQKEKEHKLIRLRALDSIAEIAKRSRKDERGRKVSKRLKMILRKLQRHVRDRIVRNKIQRTLRAIRTGGSGKKK